MTVTTDWNAISIETSGHIFRIFGPDAMRQELKELLARFESVGTTAFVCREFDVVVGGLYNTIRSGMEKLPHPDRGRSFGDLCGEALFQAPLFIKGGPKMLNAVLNELTRRFEGSTPTPRQVANECRGQLRVVNELVRRAGNRVLSIHDKSTCCMFGDATQPKCEVEPSDECKLAWFSGEGRLVFLSSLETVSNSDVTEAAWIKDNIESLKLLEGVDFLRKIAKNPNSLGDAIIFWETPSDWDILTRDRAFSVLQATYRSHRRVFAVRAPRFKGETKCTLKPSSRDSALIPGRLANASATGAMVITAEPFDLGTILSVSSDVLTGQRSGRLVGTEPLGSEWGLRLSFKNMRSKPKPPAPAREVHQAPPLGAEGGAS
jgi:hypothetical protein